MASDILDVRLDMIAMGDVSASTIAIALTEAGDANIDRVRTAVIAGLAEYLRSLEKRGDEACGTLRALERRLRRGYAVTLSIGSESIEIPAGSSKKTSR